VPHKAAFPSLTEVLLNVHENIGFNVEIKFPMQYMVIRIFWFSEKFTTLQHSTRFQDSNWECERFFDANQYVDRILAVVFKNASSSRQIVFSSFVPEICVMLGLF